MLNFILVFELSRIAGNLVWQTVAPHRGARIIEATHRGARIIEATHRGARIIEATHRGARIVEATHSINKSGAVEVEDADELFDYPTLYRRIAP